MREEYKLKNSIKALIYLLPSLVIIGIFQIYPIFKALAMSFYTKYNYFKHIVFEYGFDNYINLFNDEKFILALKNTIIFVIGVVPISLILSISIAWILSSKISFKGIFTSIYFLPFITSTTAIAMVWRWIYHSQYGLLNNILSVFGLSPIQWLTDPKWAMPALIIMSVWKTLGYNILIILTALENIDQQYNYAGRIDGANWFKRFTKIIFPLISPTLFFITITSLIGAFKVFGEVYILFEKMPGPLNSCLTMVYYIYDKLAVKYSYGMASAASVVLFLIVLLVTLFQFIISRKWVHYK